jgi:hypothetical protein
VAPGNASAAVPTMLAANAWIGEPTRTRGSRIRRTAATISAPTAITMAAQNSHITHAPAPMIPPRVTRLGWLSQATSSVPEENRGKGQPTK